MKAVDSTVVRNLSTTAVLIGPQASVARVAAIFEAAYVRVVSAPNARAAGESLADVMPQVVVVLLRLETDERAALADRATAVGALVMYVDPELDEETLDELVNRAVRTALERKLKAQAEEEDAQKANPSEAPSSEEVDEGW
jgi:hypothetical protein